MLGGYTGTTCKTSKFVGNSVFGSGKEHIRQKLNRRRDIQSTELGPGSVVVELGAFVFTVQRLAMLAPRRV